MSLIDEDGEDRTGVDAAISAGVRIATAEQQPRLLAEGGAPFVLSADGQPVSLEAFLPQPLHVAGNFETTAVPSFIAYVQRFVTAGTLLTASLDGTPTVIAALDYHEKAGEPRPGKHSAQLALKQSPEWIAWTAVDGRGMLQQALAVFLEEQSVVVKEPAAAAVLEAVLNLDLHKGAQFKSARNLDNGTVQFAYVEEISGAGQMTLPTRLTITLRPFKRAEPVEVQVRLRYKLTDDKIVFTLKLDRPDLIIEAAFEAVLKQIQEATSLPVLWGKVG